MDVLNPVILPVPESKKQVKGREKVLFLSAYAREALHQSAALSQVCLGDLEKDEDGVPIPSRGTFWSITHKPRYVGGVVSSAPVGIDIEQIDKVTPGLYKKVAKDEEWDLGRQINRETLFFRYWTAKEAAIKAEGRGIADLLKCQVIEIPDAYTIVLEFAKKIWTIEQTYFDGHLASIVCDNVKIQWIFGRSGPKITDL